MMELIRIRNLSVELTKGNAHFVLTIPKFRAFAGEFIAVVGPSGCGKSTFLDILGLVLESSSVAEFTMSFSDCGRFDLAGPHRNDRLLSCLRRKNIGYVLQSGGLLPFLTVAQNIALPLQLTGRIGDPSAIASVLGIGEQLTKKPSSLSGGQRQRAAIARALIHQPDIILADEPTAAADPANAKAIMSVFHSLARQQNALVILATHDTNLVAGVADRTIEFAPNAEQTGSILLSNSEMNSA
jgi:putative ABC transport system ATP-binding protein